VLYHCDSVAIHTGDVLSFRDATSEREREREKKLRVKWTYGFVMLVLSPFLKSGSTIDILR